MFGVVVGSCTFHTSQWTITGACIYSPTEPPYPCAIFFRPPPFQIQFSFVNPIITLLTTLSYNIYSPLPSSYTPHLLTTYLQSYDIWWGGQSKREEAGGEERKEGAGVGRGMKNVKKNKGGMEKRKNFPRAAPRKEEGDKGREGWGLPPPLSTLSYLKSRL